MRLDVTQPVSSTNKTPAVLRFSYLKGGVRNDLTVPLTTAVATGLPTGYLYACDENQTDTRCGVVFPLSCGGEEPPRQGAAPQRVPSCKNPFMRATLSRSRQEMRGSDLRVCLHSAPSAVIVAR